ncbi:hypothetical protein Taro_003875 [Colocasia esculenta]|uniref:Uncharacterized protein n=1 Tax=Colocasia esculenta TaxID=4460 RepID=A0A843TQ31_COLES|nr:hypothetical protein [Colocasia esculenta]
MEEVCSSSSNLSSFSSHRQSADVLGEFPTEPVTSKAHPYPHRHPVLYLWARQGPCCDLECNAAPVAFWSVPSRGARHGTVVFPDYDSCVVTLSSVVSLRQEVADLGWWSRVRCVVLLTG